MSTAKDIVIYADNREAKTKVVAILKKKCKLKQKQLDVADYLLSKKVCCERKTSEDFLQSIVDGRLFKQIKAMKVYPQPLLIIEGDVMESDRDIHPNAVRGALAAIACEFSIPIISTTCQYETAEMLLSIAKREQLGIKNSVGIRTKKKSVSMNQLQEFLVAGFPKVSTITAKRLLKHFRTPKAIFAASEAELMRVDGIGKKMAKNIRKILTKKYEKSILD